jgi:hypothetical protein
MLYILFTMGKLNWQVVDLGALERLGFGSRPVADDAASVWVRLCRLLGRFALAGDFALWIRCWVRPIRRFVRYDAA